MDIPWWGWALIVGGSLIALYYAIGMIFAAKMFKRVFRTFDDVSTHTLGGKDPFDDPFFKRGPEVRRPNKRYL